MSSGPIRARSARPVWRRLATIIFCMRQAAQLVLSCSITARVTSEWGGWSPIGAVKTANGYDVAWKVAGADGYTVWSTDNNGNYLSNIVGILSGASWSLESLETVFNQDLNADGVIGSYVAPRGTLEVTLFGWALGGGNHWRRRRPRAYRR